MKGPIVLLTDFGSRDPYVGVMKGVILARAPKARIVDLCHEVPPQDIRAAAFYLLAAGPYFPAGSLFVAVVDPGVGSRRRIVWGRTAKHQFLFPDNGCASWLAQAEPFKELREASNRALWLPNPGSTFHGRDIFAAVAGSLARGAAPARVGPRIKTCVRIPFPAVSSHGAACRGEILAVDRFGNAITNFRAAQLRGGAQLRFKGRGLGAVRAHYAEVPEGAPLALTGSAGFLELSVRNGDFARAFGARPGDPVDAA